MDHKIGDKVLCRDVFGRIYASGTVTGITPADKSSIGTTCYFVDYIDFARSHTHSHAQNASFSKYAIEAYPQSGDNVLITADGVYHGKKGTIEEVCYGPNGDDVFKIATINGSSFYLRPTDFTVTKRTQHIADEIKHDCNPKTDRVHVNFLNGAAAKFACRVCDGDME